MPKCHAAQPPWSCARQTDEAVEQSENVRPLTQCSQTTAGSMGSQTKNNKQTNKWKRKRELVASHFIFCLGKMRDKEEAVSCREMN